MFNHWLIEWKTWIISVILGFWGHGIYVKALLMSCSILFRVKCIELIYYSVKLSKNKKENAYIKIIFTNQTFTSLY